MAGVRGMNLAVNEKLPLLVKLTSRLGQTWILNQLAAALRTEATQLRLVETDSQLFLITDNAVSYYYITDNAVIVRFVRKEPFWKWLVYGHSYYQAKFTKNLKLQSIIRTNVRVRSWL